MDTVDCTMCKEVKRTRYIDLYVIGSEGTWLCHECEMELVGFFRERIMYHGSVKMASILGRKKGTKGRNGTVADFGFNWREFTVDGTLYRHRMEDGNYEVQRWAKRGNAVGAWVPCRCPFRAPKLWYQEKEIPR